MGVVLSIYENEFPAEGGPFGIGRSLIRETMDRTDPSMTITLDFGAFRRVWEIVEESARTHYPTRETLSTARAEVRSVEAFRRAWFVYSTNNKLDGASSGARRKLKRSGGPSPIDVSSVKVLAKEVLKSFETGDPSAYCAPPEERPRRQLRRTAR